MLRNSTLLLIFSFCLTAQVDHGSLNGTVTDTSNSVVPGAKVEAVSTATGLRRDAVTGNSGVFQFPSLPVGRYTVTISKAGFRPIEYKDVELV